MGAGNFDIAAYKIQAETAKVKQNSGFTATSMNDEFNPSNVSMRFSKKGPFNEFRDVITVLIGLDVTGSMDMIPKSLLQGRLGNLMVDLKKTFNKPNENLQISFAGIGDAKSDVAPLQVTHFESDNRFALQLQKIWLEGHGGGNGAESYNLLWWYAANKTHLNYTKQDGRKGILITIGDDNVHPNLSSSEIQMWLDPKYDGGNISNQVLLNAVREQYEVYHIVITDGQSYEYDNLKQIRKTDRQKLDEAEQWKNLLGNNNLIQTKSEHVADTIAEIIKKHRPIQKANMSHLSLEEWEKQNKENLNDEQWREVLSYTLCPLTRKYMGSPVSLGDGKRAYEKQAIENYVYENQKDPMTQKKLTPSELVIKPNVNIAQLCLNYKPFFDSLPEARRNQLVQLTLQDLLPISQNNSGSSSKESSGNQAGFYSSHSSASTKGSSSKQPIETLKMPHSNLECPITGEIMKDPVMVIATGQTYERKAIEQWFAANNTDPLTGRVLQDKTIVPNYAIKSLCDEATPKVSLNP